MGATARRAVLTAIILAATSLCGVDSQDASAQSAQSSWHSRSPPARSASPPPKLSPSPRKPPSPRPPPKPRSPPPPRPPPRSAPPPRPPPFKRSPSPPRPPRSPRAPRVPSLPRPPPRRPPPPPQVFPSPPPPSPSPRARPPSPVRVNQRTIPPWSPWSPRSPRTPIAPRVPRTPSAPRSPPSPTSPRSPRSPSTPLAPARQVSPPPPPRQSPPPPPRWPISPLAPSKQLSSPPPPLHEDPRGGQVELNGGNCPDAWDTLSATNAYRSDHQAPDVVWSERLAEAAQRWAQQLAEQNPCVLEHQDGYFGENLYMQSSYPQPDHTCARAVDMWYREVRNYNFNTQFPFSTNYGSGKMISHFTQLVWKDTRSMGCGIGYSTYNWNGLQAACKVVACRYLPPGNIMNERLYITNVLPKK